MTLESILRAGAPVSPPSSFEAEPSLAAASSPSAGAADALFWTETFAQSAESVLAASRSTDTCVIQVPGFGRAVRKRMVWAGAKERWKGLFRTTGFARSPARREVEHARLIRDLALPDLTAPAPLGFAEARGGGLLQWCLALFEEVPDALDLASWLRDEKDGERRGRILVALARGVRGLHRHATHRELHPRNVLVPIDGNAVVVVDLAKLRTSANGPSRDACVGDLACLDVGLERFATADERTSVMRTYLDDPEPRTLARWMHDVEMRRAAIAPRESRRLPDRRS